MWCHACTEKINICHADSENFCIRSWIFLHYLTNPYKTPFFPTLEFSYIFSFISSRKQVTEMSNVTINTSVAGESLKPEEIIRIIESLRLENASKIIEPTFNPAPPCIPLSHISMCHIYTPEYQEWWSHHYPGQPRLKYWKRRRRRIDDHHPPRSLRFRERRKKNHF